MEESIMETIDYDLCARNVCNDDTLLVHMKKYCDMKGDKSYIVSLSGGVDSMVIATLLKALDYHVTCVHINYNNRDESVLEADFLSKWCTANNVQFIYENIMSLRRGNVNRKVYEEKTRQIRFDLYKKIITETDASSICLGHHDDDIIENVVSNICKGQDLTDLAVMKVESSVHGVQISRPLIGMRKNRVYDFAQRYKVPYFKDTTPDWSIRGKFRKRILPFLRDTYTNVENNLLQISRQSEEWDGMIHHFIISPFMASVEFDDCCVKIPIKDYADAPLSFWKHVFKKIFFKYGIGPPSSKNMNQFHMNLMVGKKTILGKNVYCEIKDNILFLHISK